MYRQTDEHKEKRKISDKQYYENNKEKIQIQKKQHSKTDKNKEYQKKYYENNKKQLQEQSKERYKCKFCKMYIVYKKPYLCSNCNPNAKKSKGELEISKLLKQYKFKNQNEDIKLCKYVFYLPKLNTIIEFHGIQHYKFQFFSIKQMIIM